MAIKKTTTNKWQADVSVGGRLDIGGERIRKTFRTQREAASFENAIKGNFAQGKKWDFAHNKKDYRLSELCEMWFDFHGQNLKDAKNRKRTLERVCKELKNPFLSRFIAQDFLKYRNNHKTAGATHPQSLFSIP